MCSKEDVSDFRGAWSRGLGSRKQGRFGGIGKRLGQSKQDGAFVDGKCFVLNALKCFGIS